MTTKEAIETLRNAAWLGSNDNREKTERAVEMAIKALQAQDCDTISRQAVMRMLTNLSYNQCKTQGEADLIDTAKTMVITMPSVQPDVPDTNVGDLISRQAAIDEVEEWMDIYASELHENERAVLAQVRHSLKKLPSAQPDIIRCRDCKFYTPLNRETKSGICSLLIHQNFGDDWYCAGAERRTNRCG